jgi:hypothetical protein
MSSIINELRKELRKKIKISYEMTQMDGSIINEKEKFKVRFIIKNTSEFTALIKKITIENTKYAEVLGANFELPNKMLEKHLLHKEERPTNKEMANLFDGITLPRIKSTMKTMEFEMRALKSLNTNELEYEEPFAKVYVDASFDPKDILTIRKEETENTNIHRLIHT